MLVLTGAATALAALCTLVLTRPLQRIIRATEGFAQGRTDVPLPVRDRSEIGTLARSFRSMIDTVERRTEDLRQSGERIRQLNEELEQRVRARTTELEQANVELHTANEALARARDAAETANRAKSQFLANMNHEL